MQGLSARDPLCPIFSIPSKGVSLECSAVPQLPINSLFSLLKPKAHYPPFPPLSKMFSMPNVASLP